MTKPSKDQLIFAGGVLLAGYLAYRLTRPSAFDQLQQYVEPALLTFPKPYYEVLAYNIQSAFWATWYTEDEASIIENMKQLQNDSDYLYLVSIYGARNSNGVDGLPTWIPSPFAPESLPQSLQKHLSQSDLAEINQHFASKGINFQFISEL